MNSRSRARRTFDGRAGRHHQRKTSAGFTLLELLLTLSVIAVIASLTLPNLSLLLGDRRLARGGEQLQIEISRLRIDAMQRGEVLMLQAKIGTSEVRIEPYQSEYERSGESSGTNQAGLVSESASQPGPADERTLTLPEPLQIESVTAVSAARSLTIEQQVDASSSNAWSRPVLFYPDGTTSTAAIIVVDPQRGKQIIRIRGITGETSVTEVFP